MVFHLVGPKPEHFVRLEAVAPGGHAAFFLDRIWSVMSGAQYAFAAMAEAETLTTLAARFEPWTDAPGPFRPSAGLPDPRSIVKDFTSRGHVPADVRPWLLAGAPRVRGEVYET